MRIGVPTNYAIPDIKGPYFSDLAWIEKTFLRLKRSGFRLLDWSACDFARIFTSPGDTPLVRDGWMDFAESYLDIARKNGFDFKQAHGLIFNPFNGSEQSRFLMEMEPRVFDVCKLLGVKRIVKHAYMPIDLDWSEDKEKCISKNVEYFKWFADLAGERGMYLAIENSFTLDRSIRVNNTPEAVLTLVERVARDNVCVCLDVGHANVMGEDLYETCVSYGEKLACLHIHDNDGTKDQHRMPFHGTIDFKRLTDGLKKIRYSGDFTLEVHPIMKASELLREHQEKEAYLACRQILEDGGIEIED